MTSRILWCLMLVVGCSVAPVRDSETEAASYAAAVEFAHAHAPKAGAVTAEAALAPPRQDVPEWLYADDLYVWVDSARGVACYQVKGNYGLACVQVKRKP